jgi:hypothetical protein
MNIIDRHFQSLMLDDCQRGIRVALVLLMRLVDSSSEEYRHLAGYLQSTHGSTHNWYSLDVDDIFRVKRRVEEERWNQAGWYVPISAAHLWWLLLTGKE